MTDAAYKPHTPFKPVVVLGLVLIAVFALSAIGVLSAYSPQLSRGDDGRAHALSKSAIGYGGLVRLLRETGREVILNRGAAYNLSPDSLLILTPSPEPDQTLLGQLTLHQGTVLVVLPKWEGLPDPRHPGWVGGAAPVPAADSLAALPKELEGELGLKEAEGPGTGEAYLFGDPLRMSRIAGLRTLTTDDWAPILTDGAGGAILALNESTGVYLLSDPDLLTTAGLNDPVKARAALAVINAVSDPEQPVVFDLSLNGFGGRRSVLRLLLEPPLVGFTLCLALAVALVGWQAAIRFAPHRHARRAVALGKKALADNTAALVRLARRERSMATPYADLVRSQAAKAVAAPPNLPPEALTALLDRLAARQGVETPYARLAEDAADAKTASDLMTVVRALNRWKSEMTRGRG